MNRRTLIALGVAGAATIAGSVLLTPKGVDRTEVDSAGLAFPGLAERLAGAARVEVKKPDATLVLLRQGESWGLPDKGRYPVRAEKVRELLVGLTELRLVEKRTADPNQLDRLGVDDPARPGSTALLLRVLDGGGAPLAELILGRRRVRTQGNVPEIIYVRRPAEPQAWLAEGRLAADADPQLWLDRDIANLAQDRIRRVVVQRTGEPELILARDAAPEAKLHIEVPADAPAPDEVALDEIARGFEYLTFLDVKPAAAIPGEALGEAQVTLAADLSITVRPNKDGETLWIRLQATGGEEAARLNARWAGWAYQVGAWKEKAFVPRLADLKPRETPPK